MKNRKNYIRYGEAFKRQVVDEIERGKFTGAYAAGRAYGIKGATTVSKWIREYGSADLLPKKITIHTLDEQDENKELKKRVKELERALADSYMSGLLKESYLEIACERMGTDVEAFKKKHVTNLSGDRRAKEAK
jgi:transposase-like protein